MKAILSSEPYKSAIKEVEHNKLSTYHGLMHRLMIIGSPLLILLAFKAKECIKAVLGKKM
ncbi:MAG: hypothetical protein LUC91_05325 [Prevotella sp.]|nr:hypothetical protein [Prevotella sp.]